MGNPGNLINPEDPWNPRTPRNSVNQGKLGNPEDPWNPRCPRNSWNPGKPGNPEIQKIQEI